MSPLPRVPNVCGAAFLFAGSLSAGCGKHLFKARSPLHLAQCIADAVILPCRDVRLSPSDAALQLLYAPRYGHTRNNNRYVRAILRANTVRPYRGSCDIRCAAVPAKRKRFKFPQGDITVIRLPALACFLRSFFKKLSAIRPRVLPAGYVTARRDISLSKSKSASIKISIFFPLNSIASAYLSSAR